MRACRTGTELQLDMQGEVRRRKRERGSRNEGYMTCSAVRVPNIIKGQCQPRGCFGNIRRFLCSQPPGQTWGLDSPQTCPAAGACPSGAGRLGIRFHGLLFWVQGCLMYHLERCLGGSRTFLTGDDLCSLSTAMLASAGMLQSARAG